MLRILKRIIRVDVHLGEEIDGRRERRHKRCAMEVRLAGCQPIVVTHHAKTADEAFGGAVAKLAQLIEAAFCRPEGNPQF